MMVVTPQWKIY